MSDMPHVVSVLDNIMMIVRVTHTYIQIVVMGCRGVARGGHATAFGLSWGGRAIHTYLSISIYIYGHLYVYPYVYMFIYNYIYYVYAYIILLYTYENVKIESHNETSF